MGHPAGGGPPRRGLLGGQGRLLGKSATQPLITSLADAVPGSVRQIVLGSVTHLHAVYVANFGHYNKVYGSLGAVIIFLVWMWVSNVAILIGAEFRAG